LSFSLPLPPRRVVAKRCTEEHTNVCQAAPRRVRRKCTFHVTVLPLTPHPIQGVPPRRGIQTSRVVRFHSLLCPCSRGAESLTATNICFRQSSLSPAASLDPLEPPPPLSLLGLSSPPPPTVHRSPITETRSRCKPCTSPSRACTPAASC
ncbi:unnamed protein product, partial [Ectocarpus fasciculatus]